MSIIFVVEFLKNEQTNEMVYSHIFFVANLNMHQRGRYDFEDWGAQDKYFFWIFGPDLWGAWAHWTPPLVPSLICTDASSM